MTQNHERFVTGDVVFRRLLSDQGFPERERRLLDRLLVLKDRLGVDLVFPERTEIREYPEESFTFCVSLVFGGSLIRLFSAFTRGAGVGAGRVLLFTRAGPEPTRRGPRRVGDWTRLEGCRTGVGLTLPRPRRESVTRVGVSGFFGVRNRPRLSARTGRSMSGVGLLSLLARPARVGRVVAPSGLL